jgi:hypothetical protein
VLEPPSSLNFQAAADKAVLGICELLGLLFGLPFGEDLYRDRPFGEIPLSHWLYLAIGIFFAGGGFMFPWMRTRTWIPEIVSASLSKAALDARYWIAALLTIFIYTIGPEIYRRAVEPRAGFPTADEIAAAMVHALPKSNSTALAPPPAVVTKQPELPNPLQPESVKWRATTRLVDISKKENLKCKVLIVRNPLSYAEDYAADLKPILEAARWDYEVSLATGELEKGLSARAPSEPGIKRQCAEAFLLRPS